MEKEILLEMLGVSRYNCEAAFREMDSENADFRLVEKTATAGFLCRHIAETTNTLGQHLGFETDVEDTTLGKEDTGQRYSPEESRRLLEQAYDKLEGLVKNNTGQFWMETVDASFFGAVTRMKLLSIILLHNAHHCGQAASALIKGRKFEIKEAGMLTAN